MSNKIQVQTIEPVSELRDNIQLDLNEALILPPSEYPLDQLPSYEDAVTGNDASQWKAAINITTTEAINALADHIAQNCCWGTGPMKRMEIISIEPSTAYTYIIMSWNETRRVGNAHRPYPGGPIDSPDRGEEMTDFWGMKCQTPDKFEEKVYKIPIPHTDECKTCFKCAGRGDVMCTNCYGYGVTGRGDNKRRCRRCHGSGRLRCATCSCHGTLVHFRQLTVEYLGR